MNKILIIEDEKSIANQLEYLAYEQNPNIMIYKAGSKVEVMEILKNHTINAFFIDIQLEDYNGLELAKELRKLSDYQFVPMVFITAVPTRELEAFRQVHSYDYILKPFTIDEVKKVFREILLDYFNDSGIEETIILEYKSYNHTINTRDILYVEMYNRRIHIITKDDNIEYNVMSLTKFHEKLPESFVRVHQSYIINKRYLESYSLSLFLIKLDGCDVDIPIGRSFIKNVKGKLI